MQRRRRLAFWSATLVFFLALTPPLFGAWLYIDNLKGSKDRSVVSIFNVGQGSCALLSYNEVSVLVDCGSSQGFTDKEELLNLMTLMEGIVNVELLMQVVISHADQDHYNLLHKVLPKDNPIEVKKVWLGGRKREYTNGKLVDWLHGKGQTYLSKNRHAKRNRPSIPFNNKTNGIYFLTSTNGDDSFTNPDLLDEGTTSEPLGSDTNEQSAIVLFRHHKFSVILPGDGGHVSQRMVEKNYPKEDEFLEATVVVASHHGAHKSNGPLLYSRARPQVVVYSAGLHEGHRHPKCSTLSLYGNSDRGRLWSSKQHEITCFNEGKNPVTKTSDKAQYSTNKTGSVFVVYEADKDMAWLYACKNLKSSIDKRGHEYLRNCTYSFNFEIP